MVVAKWNEVWLVFVSWVISYVNEWEDHPNHFGNNPLLPLLTCLRAVLTPLTMSVGL